MEYKSYLTLFENNFEKIKSHLGWSVDTRVSLMLSSQYSARGKDFSPRSFSEVIEAIKQQTKWYHTIRMSSTLQYSLAMMLDDKGDPQLAVKKLLENEQFLKSAKLTRTQYSYLAALFLPEETEQKKRVAENAQKLYKAIRKHHPFLTSYEDIPYVVLLSSGMDDTEVRAETMNRYYKELRQFNFWVGNELQWLSQILTFHSAEYVEQLVPYVVELRKQLNEQGIKIKQTHYPILGFLAVAGVQSEQIQKISKLYKELSQFKKLRWYKDIILSIAVQKILHELVSLTDSLEMSTITSLESLIQAEQAMMMTVTIAAVAASSSSSSSD